MSARCQTANISRFRKPDGTPLPVARSRILADLEAVIVTAKSLFETLNMPQKPDGLRILDQDGDEVFFWTPGADDA